MTTAYSGSVPVPPRPSEPFILNRNYKGTHIISLHQDPYGHIWAGTFGDGLLRLDPSSGRISRYTTADGLANDNILSIDGTRDELWFATLGGASRCPIPGKAPNGAGVLRFEGFGQESGLGNNFIYSVFVDSKQRTWFGTDGKGITVRSGGRFINYADSLGKDGSVVYSVTEDKAGLIWFSTASQGLYSFDGTAFRNYTSGSGLSDMNIAGLKASANGAIFIVHPNGIDVLDPGTGKFNYFGQEDGLTGINPDLNAITSDPGEGLVWIGTATGIIRMEEDPYKNLDKPLIRITGVRIFLAASDTTESHHFPSRRNHFTFDFAGLWYKAPERVTYEVMLDGYDLDWIPTRNPSVTYSSLGSGTYTFRVRASLNGNFTGAETASYHFVIRPPVWRAWWFILLVVVLLTGTVLAIVRMREKRLRREEALQKENILFQFETLKSQVNPHFLFNSFSTLSAIIDENKEMALDYVQNLSAFFRNILEYRDKSLITVEEELKLLDHYYFIQKQRYGEHLRLVTDLPAEYLRSFIPPLTLQLIFENAVKHNGVSAGRPLTVKIEAQGDAISVSNNRQPKAGLPPSTGTGLTNIRNRYLLLSRKEIRIITTREEFMIVLPVIKNKLP